MLDAIADHLPVMLAQGMPFQRLDDLGNSLLGTAFGQLRDLHRLCLAFQQGQHQLSADAEYIRQHVAQFHVGVL